MKTQHMLIGTVLLILTFGLTDFAHADYGWVDISDNINAVATTCPTVDYTDFSDVHFVTDNEGWITSSCIGEIYHTTDGGDTFEVQTTDSPTLSIFL